MKAPRYLPRPGPSLHPLWLAAAILVVSAAPRLLTPSPFVTRDEPLWVYRSLRFLTAISTGQLASTFQSEHPGVTTMWLGSLGLMAYRAAGLGSDDDWTWLAALPKLNLEDGEALWKLAVYLPWSQVPLAMAVSFGSLLCYAALQRLVGLWPAAVASALLVFSPFYLAHSRVLHLDGLLSVLTLLSVLFLLVWVELHSEGPFWRGGGHWIAFSGAAAGLAMLTKTPALFLGPFCLSVLLFWPGSRWHRWMACLVWGAAAAGAAVLAWPSLWVHPLSTLRGVLQSGLGHAEVAYVENFFLGQPVANPSPLFYLYSLAYRSTPLTLGGLLAVAVVWHRMGGRQRRLVIALLGLAIGFAALMSLPAKKFDRYMLPPLLALDLVAGLGLAAAAKELWLVRGSRLARGAGAVVAVVALGGQAFCSLPMHPYYLSYYNPLFGGAKAAVGMVSVGWGEGLEQAAAYLNRLPDASNLVTASWATVGLASRFQGQVIPLNGEASLLAADYVVVYVSDIQMHLPLVERFYGRAQPAFVLRERDIDYTFVYRNDFYQPVLETILSVVADDDVVIFGQASKLDRLWPAGRPKLVLGPDADTRALATLPAGRRAWYLDFDADTADNPDRVREVLETGADRGPQESLGPVGATAYDVPAAGIRDRSVSSAVGAVFGGRLRLLQAGLSTPQPQPGRALVARLSWELVAPADADYSVFVHLLNDKGERVAQKDRQLQNQRLRPTTTWSVGETTQSVHLLRLDRSIPVGQYLVVAGLYRFDTGERLGLDREGLHDGTALVIGTVNVR